MPPKNNWAFNRGCVCLILYWRTSPCIQLVRHRQLSSSENKMRPSRHQVHVPCNWYRDRVSSEYQYNFFHFEVLFIGLLPSFEKSDKPSYSKHIQHSRLLFFGSCRKRTSSGEIPSVPKSIVWWWAISFKFFFASSSFHLHWKSFGVDQFVHLQSSIEDFLFLSRCTSLITNTFTMKLKSLVVLWFSCVFQKLANEHSKLYRNNDATFSKHFDWLKLSKGTYTFSINLTF